MKDKRRIIFLHEVPFTQDVESRLGAQFLVEGGFDVEFWEVTALFLPLAQDQWISPPFLGQLRKFDSIQELKDASDELRESDTVILLCGIFTHQIYSHRKLIKTIGESKASMCAITQGNMPRFKPMWRLGHLRRWLGKLVRLGQRVVRPGGRRSKRGELFRLVEGFRPLNTVWAGVTPESIDSSLIGPKTRIELIHNFDYDRVLAVRRAGTSMRDGRKVTLIDHMGFSHPDGRIFGVKVDQDDEDRYFSAVREALCDFETVRGMYVDIAAHPRAEPGSLDKFYGGRRVVHNQTAECISQSEAVLVMNVSTAVGLGVALNRPMIVLHSADFQTGITHETSQLAKALSLPIVNLDISPRNWEIPEVDLPAYKEYFGRYVKGPLTPELPFGEVVANSLAELHKKGCVEA